MPYRVPNLPGPYGMEPAFSESFDSRAHMIGRGWTLVNAPAFGSSGGLVLNGTTQYARLQNGTTLQSAFRSGVPGQLSVQVEFTPGFNFNSVLANFFYDNDAAAGTRFYLYKIANPDNRLVAAIGSALVVAIAPADYSALWTVGTRMQIVLACDGVGSNAVYINGTPVTNASAAGPFSRTAPAGFLVGVASGGAASFFAGTIHNWGVFNRKLTAMEALNLWQTGSL